MAEADDYIAEDDSIKWADIGATVVGTAISLTAYFVATYLGLVRQAVVGVLEGIGWAINLLISRPFEVGNAVVRGLFRTSADSVGGLGIFAWPVAVGVVSLTSVLVMWSISAYTSRAGEL